MADNGDKPMAAPTPLLTLPELPIAMPQASSSIEDTTPQPDNDTNDINAKISNKATDQTLKARMGVDFAAHHLPFRPAPMVRKRRTSTESPERDVRRRVGEQRNDGGYTTDCFTSAAAPETGATAGDGDTNFRTSTDTDAREDYLTKLAAHKTKAAPSAAVSPEASAVTSKGDELPGYEETAPTAKGLRRSRRAKPQGGEASEEVEMGGTEGSKPPQTVARPQDATLPKPREWTGMPALDLLHGRWMEVPAQQHAGDITERIMSGLKERRQANSDLVLQGRTVDYNRIHFDLGATDQLSFRKRLEQCFNKRALVSQQQAKVQKAIHEALEAQLWYIVCWNLHAFPEIAGKKDGAKEVFPALFPGSHTSVLDVLHAGQRPLPQLDFSKAAATAKVIFDSVLQRVRAKAPDSPLLHVEQILRPVVGAIPKNLGESKQAFRHRRKLLRKRHEADPTPPESLLTLAFTAENFYTALVRKMRAVVDEALPKKVDDAKVEIAVETLLYRLALKEPRAFSEVFE
ncbi:hypothetical protein LTR36_007865 [Oleoguttula mirabilis]|uniref:Uncharacterized protein n=1 Tax=Oleoguttula mirabilis TaxID=1507867 RepID=A0AAV9JAZ6_9PEZI|nr:hypothetical protein LTR36_007865 [Oleoguttula mirabilis]